LAQQVVKDLYNFEFLILAERANKRDLEEALLKYLRDFLLERGVGFAFVESRYALQVGGHEFRIDLLFYHLRLRAYIALQPKREEFKPELSGKTNLYFVPLTTYHEPRRPTRHRGHSLQAKNKVVAEYALRDLGASRSESLNIDSLQRCRTI
jgi:hypothetical protein